jgi:hypothetical protein
MSSFSRTIGVTFSLPTSDLNVLPSRSLKHWVMLKRLISGGSGPEAIIDIFDGTFEGEFAELSIPAAGA